MYVVRILMCSVINKLRRKLSSGLSNEADFLIQFVYNVFVVMYVTYDEISIILLG